MAAMSNLDLSLLAAESSQDARHEKARPKLTSLNEQSQVRKPDVDARMLMSTMNE